MKREFEIVRQFLRTGKSAVRLNKTWHNIHDTEGLGEINGQFLRFSPEAKLYLRKWFKEQTGIDALTTNTLPKDRIGMAKLAKNEKLAKKGVFEGQLRIAARSNVPIETINGRGYTPRGTTLMVPADQLIINDRDVIVIENGAIMEQINGLMIPDELNEALFIYRGHESDARELKALLNQQKPKRLIGFYDLDPAGLLMGISNNYDALLLPDIWKDIQSNEDVLNQINKTDSFWSQGKQLVQLQKASPRGINEIIDAVTENTLAIMQEHMLAYGLTLELVKLADR